MKRTISEDRAPEPLEVYADTDDVKDGMVDLMASISDEGYDENFIYQIGFTAPPLEDTDSIIDSVEDDSIYITVTGIDEEGKRYGDQFFTDYRLENTDSFERTAKTIDEVVSELGYELEFWHLSSVATSNVSGSQVADELSGLEINAVAKVDAGLDAQRGDTGFQPISIGWFQKAPMADQTQFGYRAFPNREFQHDEEKDYEQDEEDPVEDILGRITGVRDDEINMHHLSEEEIEVLSDLEEEMNRRDLL